MASRVPSMLIGAAALFLAAFLRDRRFFLPAFRLAFFLVFLLAGLLLAAFLLAFLLAFFLVFLFAFLFAFFLAFFFVFLFAVFLRPAFFLAGLRLVAFFLAPAFRFLATRFFAVFFLAAFRLVVRFFLDVPREDFFFARDFDFLRVALANGHLLKACAFVVGTPIGAHYMD